MWLPINRIRKPNSKPKMLPNRSSTSWRRIESFDHLRFLFITRSCLSWILAASRTHFSKALHFFFSELHMRVHDSSNFQAINVGTWLLISSRLLVSFRVLWQSVEKTFPLSWLIVSYNIIQRILICTKRIGGLFGESRWTGVRSGSYCPKNISAPKNWCIFVVALYWIEYQINHVSVIFEQ